LREDAAAAELISGNIPDLLRKFKPVKLRFGKHTGFIFVSPDFLAIGDDTNFIRWPMTPLGAQKVMKALGCTFPTQPGADAIFAQAGQQLSLHAHVEWVKEKDPEKLFGILMRQNAQFVESNKRIDGDGADPKTKLVAGHKKDLILHPNVLVKHPALKGLLPVIIYGAKFSGKFPLQDPGPNHHDNGYEDYSHGVRLVGLMMELDGKAMKVNDVIRIKELAPLLTGFFDPKFPLEYPRPPTGPLSVRVIGDPKQDMVDVLVQVTGPSAADAKTNREGIASFPELTPGEYDILAKKDGFLPGRGKAKVSAPREGEKADGPADAGSPQVTMTAVRFPVQLEEPGIEAEASESKRSWAENKAIITGVEKGVSPSAQGVVNVPEGASQPSLVRVERITGGGLANLHWRIAPGTAASSSQGTHIALHTRLRNSVWTAAGFLLGEREGGVRPKPAERLKKLEPGLQKVDDVSVYDTHTTKVDDKGQLVLVGAAKVTDDEYKKYIEGLHGMKVQVHAGLKFLGTNTASTAFLGWLRAAPEPKMKIFGKNVLETLTTAGFDGFGVDLEDEKMAPSDRAKVTALLQAVATALNTKGKVLTIAGGVFSRPGENPPKNFTQPHQVAQPPDIGVGFPNIIFRPMSYRSKADKTDQAFKDRFESCVDAVLAKLHPGQVQMAVNQGSGGQVVGMTKDLMADVCKTILHPRRVGCIYWVLGAFDPPTERLEAIHAALNPDPAEAPHGTLQQPLQAPLGSSGGQT
jgi:hypothetical protein